MTDLLHVAPEMSAAMSLRQAVQAAGSGAEVVGCQDDLSFGPIASDAASVRRDWWSQIYDSADEVESELTTFWSRVTQADSPVVLWFGRRSALEFAFALAFADRMGARPYSVVDVTDLDSATTRWGQGAAFLLNPPVLASLFGKERPVAGSEVAVLRDRWQVLKRENAPFRVVAGTELVSVPIEHFDPVLLRVATQEWQPEARIIGGAMAEDEAYLQVGDIALMSRVVALVEQGKLLADGDPWHIRDCRIKLP